MKPPPPGSNENNQAYEKWIDSMDWKFFVTFTTRYEMTLKTARRYMERFHRELSKAGATQFFWVAEPFELKDGFHTHALLLPPPNITYKNMLHIWQRVTGAWKRDKHGRLVKADWNRIDLQPYDPNRRGSEYVSKYVLKKHSDYDFHC